jgi:Flp pilus assembly protein TadG
VRPRTFWHRGESGSASLEAVIGVPAFALFIGLIIFGGRTATSQQAVESAAADAARSASITRSSNNAQQAAEQAAQDSLANQHLDCLSVTVNVDTGGFTAPVGQSGSVVVTVGCRLDLSSLSVPGVPGSRTVEATMSSPLDPWREHAS